jgi:hypothetical protein
MTASHAALRTLLIVPLGALLAGCAEPPTAPQTSGAPGPQHALMLVATTPVVVEDVTFDDAHWEIYQERSQEGGSHQVAQSISEGNPAASRRMVHTLPLTGNVNVPSTINVRHRYIGPGSVYDPAIAGAIDRIDITMDRIVFSSTPPGGAVGHAFIVYQNGILYFHDLGAFSGANWHTVQFNGLGAQDFATTAGATPDFSASGSPLTFGYLRSNANTGQGAEVVMVHGIDNWRFVIHPTAPVLPELPSCAGPATGGAWRNHGEYMAAVTRALNRLVEANVITAAQRGALIAQAAASACGS